jgi:hypothetical protein
MRRILMRLLSSCASELALDPGQNLVDAFEALALSH